MSKAIQAVRGMNDLLPDGLGLWRRIEDTARAVLGQYGYREIRFPLVEKTELYARSIGAVTDIVEKEMYSFEDRNGDSLSLRPEGTAGCVRAGIESGLLHNQIQRLWYAGPMFRHERPQKGRYRQFHQIGVEVFGVASADIDAELICLSARLWRQLGIGNLHLELNSLGTAACRAAYRERLVAYLRAQQSVLDDDSRRRVDVNPLRVLDSKSPAMRDIIAQAPSFLDHLDADSAAHFEHVKSGLDDAGIAYRVNPRLVRGLDYYTRTVFEWVSETLGAQGTVCAGGRYDGLVEQLGGQATPAVGFALGMERLVELAAQHGTAGTDDAPLAYLVMLGDAAERYGARVGERLRDAGISVEANVGGGSLKSQMKRADRSRARFALLLGESEMQTDTVGVKSLRDDARQLSFGEADLIAYLKAQTNF